MIFILSGIICISQGKETDPSEAVEEQIENQTETSETETEDDSFLQDLAHYRRYPINLNAADASELRVLRLLSDLQIHHLLVYRNLLGPFINSY